MAKTKAIWTPFPGAQERFLSCPVWECLLHGNRGGGKTDVLLMDYLQGVGQGYGSDYKGLILREATTELGDLITKSKKWIPQIFPNATFNNQRKIWTFADEETLWMNYARVEDDYEAYHGHSYSINANDFTYLANGTYKKAKDIKIGDSLRTLQGSRKVTKVLKYKKPAIKVSVLDADLNLIGTQHQGIIHPVLTTAGWLRIGLSHSFQMPEQSVTGEHLLKEVSQFLHGIHQEILEVVNLTSSGNFFPISASMPKWYSCLYQIVSQFLHSIIQHSSMPEFQLYELLKNHETLYYKRILGIFVEGFRHEFPKSVQLLCYCLFLIDLLQGIQKSHVRLLQSTLFHSTCSKPHGQHNLQSYQGVQQYLNEKDSHLQIVSEFDLLIRNQTVLNDISSCVPNLIYKELNCLDRYFHGHGPDDVQLPRVLGIFQSSFQEKDDVLKHDHSTLQKGDLDILPECTPAGDVSAFYTHPYTHELCQTKLPLESLSFSVSSCVAPIDMVDFEVESDNHYLSLLNNIDNENSQQLLLINQNCFIGWEELTNHPTDKLYLKMMSCSRTANKNIKLKYRATCNPSGPGHQWVKARFIDKMKPERVFTDENGMKRTHIVSSLTENLAMMEADPNYTARLHAMTKDNDLLRKAWVYGSWDLVTGGFFTDVWDPRIHILPNFKIPKSWKIVRSFDWGSSRPWSVTYGAESNGEQPEPIDVPLPYFPNKSVVIVKEIYGWNGVANEGDRATSPVIANRILEVDRALFQEYSIRVQAGPADTSIWDVRDGTSIGASMSVAGCNWTKAYKGAGSRISGWAIIRQMLGAAKRHDLETPHLYFFQQAEHHIRTLPIMQRDKKKPEDIFTELEDHAMDGLRYLLARKLMGMRRKKVTM
jgi:hypothetical protein